MSGLAHYFEDEGIATTLIALLRIHAEKIEPPRALWVPFELGRPLGPPGDTAFQSRVIRAALALLERDDGPVVLEDYDEIAPDADADPTWTCPVVLDPSISDVISEIEAVRPFHEQAIARTGYSTVGVSGLSMPEIGEYLSRFDTDDPMPNPRRDLADVQVMRFAIDDLKAYYLESATSGPGRPSTVQLLDWLWGETRAGRLILALREGCIASEDKNRRLVKNWLVPEVAIERLGLESWVGR